MRLNPQLKLRRVGNMHMVVDTRTGQANMTHVYHLNDTAATVWELAAEADFTAEELAQRLCRDFEVEFETALKDVEELLKSWQEYGLLAPNDDALRR